MPDTDSPRSRWTPEVVIGLLCLVASAVLPHLDLVGVGSALALVSAWLLGPLPSPLTPRQPPDQRGHARGPLLVKRRRYQPRPQPGRPQVQDRCPTLAA